MIRFNRWLVGQIKLASVMVLTASLLSLSAVPANAAIAAANTRNTSMGAELRTLRIAISAAAGYSAQFLGSGSTELEKKQSVYASIVTGINRINEAFEPEIGVHLDLLPFNANLIFLDASTQPFSETNHSSDGLANNTLLNSVVGAANYDIGHVVSKKGGGQGTMNALTYPSSKGKGSSGGPNAIGDKFWIEIVAHEIGHQLAANHSFDGTESMCGGESEPGYNTEVGSGSSIMSYAATCGADDIQEYSDAYFTPFSYEEIRRELEGAPLIGTRTATGNAVPQISVASASTQIPPQTPFSLSATGTDADGSNTLTYAWDQIDTTAGATGKALTDEPKLAGALFRPLTPSTSGNVRTFPSLANVFAGITNQNTGSCTGVSAVAANLLACRVEFLPTTARTMKFRATIRDGVGGRNGADATVAVVGSTPFSITSQTSALVWRAGTTQTITWNTAGSEAWTTPFTQVNISYTTNRGATWVALANGVANDGSQDVTAPSISASTFRIKVQPVDAIFFDVNDADLTVSQTDPSIPTPPSGLTVAYKADTSGAVTASWSVPIETGTSTITRYEVKSVEDPTKTCATTSVAPSTPTLTCNIVGLAVGSSYTFTATAQSASGTSESSSPTAALVAAALPTAPTITGVQQTSTGGIKVSFTLGAANYSPITGIKIGHWTTSSGNYISRSTITNSGQTSFIYTTSLTVGVQYKFTVWAVNSVGVSSASNFSSLITSAKVPDAPTLVTASAGDATSTVSWTAPSSNGSDITSYLVTSSPGGLTCTTAATSCDVGGLTNGTSYTFTAVATNALGNSVASTASSAVTPLASGTVLAQAPIISSQPVASSKTVGQDVAFSATASVSDSGTLSYQWNKNGAPISGATSSNYSFVAASTSVAGTYSVTVTNTLGQSTTSTTSTGASLSVVAAPTLVTPTSGLTGTVNAVYSLAVSASGTGLVYSVSTGSLPAGLSLNSATGAVSGTPTVAGSFPIVISVTDTNSASVSSSSFTLTVAKANQASLTVTSTSGTVGAGLTLTVSGGSISGPVTYAVADGTASNCAISNGVMTANGVGTCLVTAAMAGNDSYNSVSSAQTTVSFASAALANPSAPTLAAVSGSAAELTVTFNSVADAVGYTVRIYASDGTTLVATVSNFVSGATIAGLSAGTSYKASVTAIGDGTNYSNSAESVLSSSVFTNAAADAASVSSGLPGSVSKTIGQVVSLAVSASASSGILSYQWSKNGSPILGATSASYSFTASNISESGSYTVAITNSLNGTTAVVTPSASVVTVVAAPTLVTPASGLSGMVNAVYSLAVSASGTGLVYSVSTGSLPAGLSLNSTTGAVSGTPTVAGSFPIGISVTDTNSVVVSTGSFTLEIAPGTQSTLIVTSLSTTAGSSLTLSTSGGSGTGSVTYAAIDGTATGCAIANGALTAQSSGTCLVTATKSADANYSLINSAQTAVTFSSPPPAPTPTPTPTPPSPAPAPTPTPTPVVPTPVVPVVPVVPTPVEPVPVVPTPVEPVVPVVPVVPTPVEPVPVVPTPVEPVPVVPTPVEPVPVVPTPVEPVPVDPTPVEPTLPPVIVANPKTVTGKDVQALSGEQVALIPVETIRQLPIAAVKALSTAQIRALTEEQVSAITAAQAKAVTPTQAQALTSSQVQSLTVVAIKSLTPTVFAKLTPTAVAALTPTQVKALDASKASAITSTQARALTATQVKALAVSVIDNLAPRVISSLARTTVAALTATQVKAMTTQQIRALTKAQLAALQPAARAAAIARR